MLRFLLLLILPSIVVSTRVYAEPWPAYPKDLPTFDFSGEKLKQNWSQIAKVTHLSYPDAKIILKELKQRPKLYEKLKQEAQKANAHPAIKALVKGDAQPIAKNIQDIWRDHFSGRFEMAYNKGIKLGLLGNIPALHAKLMTAILLVEDKDKKLNMLKEVEAVITKNVELSQGMPFVTFGQVYARMRILELLSTSAATSTGYVSASKDTTKKLQAQFPKRAIYPAMLGGMYAGIVERVGSFMGNIAYGATQKRAIKQLDKALQLESGLPVIYNEYARALARMDADKHKKEIIRLLKTCLTLTPSNAEEALNHSQCRQKLQHLK